MSRSRFGSHFPDFQDFRADRRPNPGEDPGVKSDESGNRKSRNRTTTSSPWSKDFLPPRQNRTATAFADSARASEQRPCSLGQAYQVSAICFKMMIAKTAGQQGLGLAPFGTGRVMATGRHGNLPAVSNRDCQPPSGTPQSCLHHAVMRLDRCSNPTRYERMVHVFPSFPVSKRLPIMRTDAGLRNFTQTVRTPVR